MHVFFLACEGCGVVSNRENNGVTFDLGDRSVLALGNNLSVFNRGNGGFKVNGNLVGFEEIAQVARVGIAKYLDISVDYLLGRVR